MVFAVYDVVRLIVLVWCCDASCLVFSFGVIVMLMFRLFIWLVGFGGYWLHGLGLLVRFACLTSVRVISFVVYLRWGG